MGLITFATVLFVALSCALAYPYHGHGHEHSAQARESMPGAAMTDKHHEPEHDYHHHPKYDYKYGVKDEHTGDIKEHHESRDGDVVKGMYSLVEPDGTRRVVLYTVHGKSGFNAIVTKEGHAAHSVAVPVKHVKKGHAAHSDTVPVKHVKKGHAAHSDAAPVKHVKEGHAAHSVAAPMMHVNEGHATHSVAAPVKHVKEGHATHSIAAPMKYVMEEHATHSIAAPVKNVKEVAYAQAPTKPNVRVAPMPEHDQAANDYSSNALSQGQAYGQSYSQVAMTHASIQTNQQPAYDFSSAFGQHTELGQGQEYKVHH